MLMTIKSSDNLRRQLEELFVESDDFKSLEKRRLGFCPFEAMGVVNAEIRHSNFLASMMDPYRPHGLGAKFLREVLDGVVAEVGAVGGISRLKLHLLDLDDADIRREWKRIDLLVAFASVRLIVAFELKIGAAESDGQLKRYRTAIEDAWPSTGDEPWTHLLLFLTRDGQKASDDGWHSVTYDIIIDAISRIMERSGGGEPEARSMLAAYARMMRKHHMDDQELAELARALWRRHREALEYLMEQRPDGFLSLGPIAVDRIEAIANGASGPGLHLVPEESTNWYVRFFVQEWEVLPKYISDSSWVSSGRLLLIELQFSRKKVNVALILGPGPQKIREQYLSAVQQNILHAIENQSKSWDTLDIVTILDGLEFYDSNVAIEKLILNLKNFVQNSVSQFDKVRRLCT